MTLSVNAMYKRTHNLQNVCHFNNRQKGQKQSTLEVPDQYQCVYAQACRMKPLQEKIK